MRVVQAAPDESALGGWSGARISVGFGGRQTIRARKGKEGRELARSTPATCTCNRNRKVQMQILVQGTGNQDGWDTTVQLGFLLTQGTLRCQSSRDDTNRRYRDRE